MNKWIFEITKMELKENSFGKNDIIVSMVKVTNRETGKYEKFATINQALLDAIKENGVIDVRDDRK